MTYHYLLLGLLSSIPSHTPSENAVCPMNLTTPNSAPWTKTFIPVSRVTLGREEREREEVEGVEGGGWELEDVRGCFARGAALLEMEILTLHQLCCYTHVDIIIDVDNLTRRRLSEILRKKGQEVKWANPK